MIGKRKARPKKTHRPGRRRKRSSRTDKAIRWLEKRLGGYPGIGTVMRIILRLSQALLAALPHLWNATAWTCRRGAAAIRWWWRLPPWLKYGKLLVIIAVVISLPLIDAARQWLHYQRIYTTYREHFYAEYVKTHSPHEADYYAKYYADFYAKYYSSPAYRRSLADALPSATAETVAFPSTSPVAELYVNDAGLTIIKRFEGLRLEPYADAGGKLTIGYGHLVKPGEFFGSISEKRAHDLLREDVRVAEAYVKRYVKVQLNENQFAALTSLVYNIGPGNFRRSTLLSLLNKGKGDLAANEFLRWNKVGSRTLPGLTERRKAEKRLFESAPARAAS